MELENISGTQTSEHPLVYESNGNELSNNTGHIGSSNPWTPTDDDLTTENDVYIKIKFITPVYIFGVKIEGAGEGTNKFVKKIKIDYKLQEDDVDFTVVQSGSSENYFDANVDSIHPSDIYFPDGRSILVTIIRIHPEEWTGFFPVFNVGLLGCYHSFVATTVQQTTYLPTSQPTSTETLGNICYVPKNLQKVYGIPSILQPVVSTSNGKFLSGNVGHLGSFNPWTPTDDDLTADNDLYIEIKFRHPVYIFGVLTEGAGNETNKFVKKIKVDYKLDEEDTDFRVIKSSEGNNYFDANVDSSEQASIYFPDKKPVLITIVRIHPQEWTGFLPIFNVGLLGCFNKFEYSTISQKTTETFTTSLPAEEGTTVIGTTTTTTPSQEEIETTVTTSKSTEVTQEPIETTNPYATKEITQIYEVQTTTTVTEKTTKLPFKTTSLFN